MDASLATGFESPTTGAAAFVEENSSAVWNRSAELAGRIEEDLAWQQAWLDLGGEG